MKLSSYAAAHRTPAWQQQADDSEGSDCMMVLSGADARAYAKMLARDGAPRRVDNTCADRPRRTCFRNRAAAALLALPCAGGRSCYGDDLPVAAAAPPNGKRRAAAASDDDDYDPADDLAAARDARCKQDGGSGKKRRASAASGGGSAKKRAAVSAAQQEQQQPSAADAKAAKEAARCLKSGIAAQMQYSKRLKCACVQTHAGTRACAGACSTMQPHALPRDV